MTEPNEKDPESKTKERRNILTGKKKLTEIFTMEDMRKRS